MSVATAGATRRSRGGSLVRAGVFVVVMLALLLVAQALQAGVLSWLRARTGVAAQPGELLLAAAALAGTALMIRSIDVRPWGDVGLGRGGLRLGRVGAGAALGAAAIGAACGALFVAGWLRIIPDTPGSSLAAALDVTVFLLPAALYEELLCRGYLLTAMRDAVGTTWAVGLTSVAFGLLHLQNAGATAESVGLVTLAGIFLAAVRVAYDSLYAAWAAHAAWNWVMAVPLHAAVSGQQFASPDYRTVSEGPAWITGGGWGPEGGLAAGVGMAAALAFLAWRHRGPTGRETLLARPGREES